MANTKTQITVKTTIGEALKLNKKAEGIFLGFGMHCLYCPMSQMETIEEAASVHGVDAKQIVEKLNELEK